MFQKNRGVNMTEGEGGRRREREGGGGSGREREGEGDKRREREREGGRTCVQRCRK